ncbi:MAG: RNA polymerase sigma factor [Rhodospirillales bacterium]
MSHDELRQLVVDQIPHLRRYAMALVGDRDRADDLVQDSLERAWSRLSLWRRDGNIRAWLFTIMHNLNANAVRQAKRRPRHDPIDEVLALPSTPANQEQRLELSMLSQAVAALPVDQRAVVLLVGLEQMRYEEVAGILDLPIGTVMSRLHRGRERLRRAMAGDAGPALRRIK